MPPVNSSHIPFKPGFFVGLMFGWTLRIECLKIVGLFNVQPHVMMTYGGMWTNATAPRVSAGPQAAFILSVSFLIQSPTVASTQSGTPTLFECSWKPPAAQINAWKVGQIFIKGTSRIKEPQNYNRSCITRGLVNLSECSFQIL